MSDVLPLLYLTGAFAAVYVLAYAAWAVWDAWRPSD